MFTRSPMLVCLVAMLSLSVPARAQQAPEPETVTVTARAVSPPFWHVTKGAAEVWILGAVGPIPEDLEWNKSRLQALLGGARLLLLQPSASAGLADVLWYLLWNRDRLSLPDGQTLDGALGPDLAARFAAAREKLHRDASRYEDDALPLAALKLEGDLVSAQNLTWSEPADTVKSLARRSRVAIRPAAEYDVMKGIKQLLALPPQASRKCVETALDDVEFQSVHAAAAAKAWASGDLAGIKTEYAPARLFQCFAGVSPQLATFYAQAPQDTLKEIEAALAGGGRTIAVVSIDSLQRKDGLLDRLRADGDTIEAPAQ